MSAGRHLAGTLVRRERVTHLTSRCTACGNSLVYVRDIGWFDPDATHSYDICPDDRYGNHRADSVVVVRRQPPRPIGSEEP